MLEKSLPLGRIRSVPFLSTLKHFSLCHKCRLVLHSECSQMHGAGWLHSAKQNLCAPWVAYGTLSVPVRCSLNIQSATKHKLESSENDFVIL